MSEDFLNHLNHDFSFFSAVCCCSVLLQCVVALCLGVGVGMRDDFFRVIVRVFVYERRFPQSSKS